jgi:hypothetical protein
MILLSIILLILSIIIFIVGYKNLTLAKGIEEAKNNTLVQIKNEEERARVIVNNLYQQKMQLLESISKEKENMSEIYEKEKERLNKIYQKEKDSLDEKVDLYKNNLSYASKQYLDNLEKTYNNAENEYNNKIKKLDCDKANAENELKKIKDSLNAAIEAQLREQEKINKLQFYKLSLSTLELEDIQKLNSIKLSLHQPVILSKLIWSTYFLKQTTELCNRVLGKEKICGIYKITNLKTEQCYIGQSVDIATRFKDHIKCGLGIDASATNKLYKAMQEDGVWNFTFELIEGCLRTDLNEKEKFWIDFYQSQKYGYNTTKGGS